VLRSFRREQRAHRDIFIVLIGDVGVMFSSYQEKPLLADFSLCTLMIRGEMTNLSLCVLLLKLHWPRIRNGGFWPQLLYHVAAGAENGVSLTHKVVRARVGKRLDMNAQQIGRDLPLLATPLQVQDSRVLCCAASCPHG
jgi:hypothetical protein